MTAPLQTNVHIPLLPQPLVRRATIYGIPINKSPDRRNNGHSLLLLRAVAG